MGLFLIVVLGMTAGGYFLYQHDTQLEATTSDLKRRTALLEARAWVENLLSDSALFEKKVQIKTASIPNATTDPKEVMFINAEHLAHPIADAFKSDFPNSDITILVGEAKPWSVAITPASENEFILATFEGDTQKPAIEGTRSIKRLQEDLSKNKSRIDSESAKKANLKAEGPNAALMDK